MRKDWLMVGFWVAGAQFCAVAQAGETLGSISDETATVESPNPPKAGSSDQKIIYRVICSPEDQDLPDCDKTTTDDGSQGAPPMLEFPADVSPSSDTDSAPPAIKSSLNDSSGTTKSPASSKHKPHKGHTARHQKKSARKKNSK